MQPKRSIYIGWDPREELAYQIAVRSIKQHLTNNIPIHKVELRQLQDWQVYTRPTEIRAGQLYDRISAHPMSTEFAISRFFVPSLARSGWALFVDCDVLARTDFNKLFDAADPKYAVMCVKHEYKPKHDIKMDGQVQSVYYRKNWSSVCLYNCDHPANRKLTVSLINNAPGRYLHGFGWLEDDLIGELSERWNWIPGHSSKDIDPGCVHFSEGTPSLPGYENSDYAEEWKRLQI